MWQVCHELATGPVKLTVNIDNVTLKILIKTSAPRLLRLLGSRKNNMAVMKQELGVSGIRAHGGARAHQDNGCIRSQPGGGGVDVWVTGFRGR